MRLIFAIAVATLTLTLASSAQQRELSRLDVLARKPVTMLFQNVPLSDALDLLAQEANIQIQVAQDADATKVITAGFRRARVAEVVDFLLKQAKLAYVVLDSKTLLITAGPESRPPAPDGTGAAAPAGIRLRFEISKNGSPVANPVVAVADNGTAILSVDNVGKLSITPSRVDAEQIAVTFDIASDGQNLKPRLVLRNQEPGTISWKSTSGEDAFDLRAVSLR